MARLAEDLEQALELGRALAATAATAAASPPASTGRNMTPNTMRRRFIRQHRRLHARALGDQPAKEILRTTHERRAGLISFPSANPHQGFDYWRA
jgi:plasmid stabilization system protein ParE